MERSQAEAYLRRMGLSLPLPPTLETLRLVQEHHLYAVPFENLDIIEGRLPLSLEPDDLFAKIVENGRGGICYELNLLLADLLSHLGYGVKLMSGRHPRYGDDFDHAFMAVSVPGEDGEWIADVGFADNFRAPLRFVQDAWQSDGRDKYLLTASEELPGYWALMRRRAGEDSLMFSFTTSERQRDEYLPRFEWFCTSPESRFTQGPLVCVERPGGRVSLTMNRVVNTFDGQRVREDIENEAQFRAALHELFGIG